MNKILLLLIIFFFQGCIALGGKKLEVKILDTTLKTSETTTTTVNKTNEAIVSSVKIVNHQLVIKGTGFDEVSTIKVKGNSFNENFSIESLTSTQIIANGVRSFSMGVGSVFDLILDSAYGAATFQINFSLCDSTLGTKGFDCTAVPNDKDVLSYDATSHKWKPRAINGLSYQGAWDATTSFPTTTGVGDYFIVSVANAPYNNGDWIVFNGSSYDHVSNGSSIISVFGRTGAVTATKGDYVLTKMGDVDLTTTAPTNGQYLKFNGTNWVPATFTAETDPTVKVFAQTNLPTCIAGQVLKSDGTALTCVTDNTGAAAFSGTANRVVATNGSGALTVTAISDTILGYLSGVTSGVQAQLDAKLNSSSFVDWSASGVQLIDPSHLTLSAGNASKAVVTSGTGAIVASSVTATELGYVSGVTSAIQTQLAGKQNLLSTGPTINGIIYPASAAATLQVPLAPVSLTDAVNKQYVDSFGQWIISGSDIYRSTGKVAIGTATPTAGTKLDITGTGSTASSIIIPRDTVANRPSGVNGMIRYASDTNKFEAYENGAWTNIISTSAAPTGTAGGDLSGTYPNPTITGLAATKIASGTVSNTVFGYLANVTSDIQTQLTSKLTSVLADTKILVGNGSNIATAVSMSGDATLANTGAVTLKNTGTAGTYSSVTTDAQGRVTAGTNPVVVTSITGTAPVTISGTAAVPIVSMAAATTAVDGYLTATNWNTFNGKQDSLTSGPTINGIVYPSSAAATLQVPLAPVNATDAVNKQYVDSFGQWTTSSGNVYRSSGNVGIGTAAPSSRLHIEAPNTAITSGALGQNTLTVMTNTAEGVDIGGSIGIGGIYDATTTQRTYGVIAGRKENSSNVDSSGYLSFYTHRVGAGIGERMRIDSLGNVGIGTVAPSSALEIAGASGTLLKLSPGTGVFTDSAYMSVNNRASFGWEGSRAAITINDLNSSGVTQYKPIVLDTGGLERVRVTSTGLVGLGNNTPTAKLTVTPAGISSGAVTVTAASAATTFTTSASTTLNVGDYLIPTTSTGQARAVTVGGTGTSFTVSPAFSAAVSGETYTVYPAAVNVSSGKLFVQGSNGNVGVGGITNPATAFEAGNVIRVTGGLSAANNYPSFGAGFEISYGTDANAWGAAGTGVSVFQSVARAGGGYKDLRFRGTNFSFDNGSITNYLSILSTGNIGIGNATPTTGTRLDITGTGAASSSIIIPRDTVANRPTTGVNGMLRYASDTNKFEAYENGAWVNMISASGTPTGSAGGDLSGTYPNPTITGLAATKIGTGTVSNTAFGYLANVSSDVQTQINGKEPTITAGTTAQYLRGDKSLSTFVSDVLSSVLTGLSVATNSAIAATDSILVSFGKLQAQITAMSSSKLDKTGGTLTVGTISGVPTPTNSDDVANKGYVDGYGQWTKTGSDIYRTSGSVGIGIASPLSTLDVAGGSRIGLAPTTLTTTSSTHTTTDTTINVVSTAGYPTSGILYFPTTSELASYSGITSTAFTGVVRGLYATTATALASGVYVDVSLITLANSTTIAPKYILTSNYGAAIGAAPVNWIGSGGLYVKGSIFAQSNLLSGTTLSFGTSSTQIISSGVSSSSDYFSVKANSIERMRIDGSGNTGFGTLVPPAFLSVNPPQYIVGTASQSGTTVTGSGTSFTSAMIGSQFIFSGAISGGTITAVASSTSLTVTTSQSVSSRAYTINYNGLNVTSTGLVGVGTVAPTSPLQVSYTNTASSGANNGLSITPTYNQTSTAAATDLLINRTETALGSGTQYLADFQVGGVSKAYLDNTGTLVLTNWLKANTLNSTQFSNPIVVNNRSGAAAATGVTMSSGTQTNSTGQYIGVSIAPTYNQTSTASATDLLINRTETAVGSGSQRLFDAQVGGSSKFTILNSGNVGIGNSSPGYTLDVTGNINVTGGMNATGTAGAAIQSNIRRANDTYIGTLNFVSAAALSSTTPLWYTGLSGSSYDYKVWSYDGSANSYKFTIQAAGNVGVGTTNPGYKLDVQGGDINASGNVRAAGVALTSDRRWKRNIIPLKNSVEKLKQIIGVSYDWAIDDYPEKNFSNKKQIGVIAQDVQAVFPELVLTDKQGFLSVNYPALIAPLIEAFKDQQKQIEANVLMFKTMQGEIYQMKIDIAENKRAIASVKEEKDKEIAMLKKENAMMRARLEKIEDLLQKKLK